MKRKELTDDILLRVRKAEKKEAQSLILTRLEYLKSSKRKSDA